MDEDDLLPEGDLGGDDAALVDTGADAGQEEQPLSIEALAVDMGWTPPEKWHGDPDKHKSAADFVRDTAGINKNLSKSLKRVEEQVSNMARTSAELTMRAVEAERVKILAERAEAIDMADHAAVDQADAKLRNLPTAPVVNPDTQTFVERNAHWFNKDRDATAWAINRAGQLGEQGISEARQLQIVEREAKHMFPEHFEEQPKPKPAPLNRPGSRGGTPQPKGFASLPDSVKAAALDYEKRSGGSISREDYARTYYEEEA